MASFNEDQNHPLMLLPEEVWRNIFKNVKSCQDVLNLRWSCTTFETILQPELCTTLFKEVLPHLFPYLEKKDILAVRRTGKEWKTAVDHLLENHGQRKPFDEETNDNRHTSLYLPLTTKGFGWTEFFNVEQVVDFSEKMNSQKNPFLGRTLWIQHEEGVEREDNYSRHHRHLMPPRMKFWPTVFNFLEKYGKHVWYFTLGTFGERNTVGRFLFILRNCLIRMPNLKSLHIFGWINEAEVDMDMNDNDDDQRLEEEDGLGFVEDESELLDHLASKPLPLVGKLETLEIEYMNGLEQVVYEHLTELHGEQLRSLNLAEERNYLTFRSSFSNLKELQIKARSPEQVDKFLQRIECPLGKLRLDLDFNEAYIDSQHLFQLLNQHFAATLQVLQISALPYSFIFSVPATNTEYYDDWFAQLLPKLKTLQIENFKRLSLNILGRLGTSLENLHIRFGTADHRREPYEHEGIDLYKYLHRDRVYESNIWSRLKKLKVLSAEFYDRGWSSYVKRFYNREMYEYLTSRGEKMPLRMPRPPHEHELDDQLTSPEPTQSP